MEKGFFLKVNSILFLVSFSLFYIAFTADNKISNQFALHTHSNPKTEQEEKINPARLLANPFPDQSIQFNVRDGSVQNAISKQQVIDAYSSSYGQQFASTGNRSVQEVLNLYYYPAQIISGVETPTPTSTRPLSTPIPPFTHTPTQTEVTVLPCMEPEPIRVYTFDYVGPSLEDYGWAEIPGGFTGAEAGSFIVEPGAASSALKVMVESGQVAFAYALQPIETQGYPILIRMTGMVLGDTNASVALAALKGDLISGMDVDGGIATNFPTTAQGFKDKRRRLCLIYEPDGSELITPLIQLASNGGDQTVELYIEKIEIFRLNHNACYPWTMFCADPEQSANPVITSAPTETTLPTNTPVPSTNTPSPTVTSPSGLGEIVIDLPDLPEGAKPLEMVLIPAGTFTMGSPDNEQGRWSNEGPQHQVTLTRDFYLGKYEVTQAQWQAVMGSNPAIDYYGKGDNYPVYYMSWDDCQTFITRLNGMGLGTFSLPTEAEWEYACRAGTTTRFYWGDDLDYSQIGQYEWYSGNNSPYGTKEVGLKLPNAWGLFDMSGNVVEWCGDLYSSIYYTSNAQTDPTGPTEGSYRVIRSGYWFDDGRHCRSAFRNSFLPSYAIDIVGFRLRRSYP